MFSSEAQTYVLTHTHAHTHTHTHTHTGAAGGVPVMHVALTGRGPGGDHSLIHPVTAALHIDVNAPPPGGGAA